MSKPTLVELLSNYANPNRTPAFAGDTIAVDAEEAKALIEAGAARAVGASEAAVTAPPETAAQSAPESADVTPGETASRRRGRSRSVSGE